MLVWLFFFLIKVFHIWGLLVKLSEKKIPLKKKSIGRVYVEEEEWEREKKEEEEEKGKAIERKKLINHTTKKWEAVNSIMSTQFCDL